MRIGLNIHPTVNGQPYSAQDKTNLTEFLRQLRPTALLVMDDWNWALAYKTLLPDTNVIFRKSHPMEGEMWQLQDADTYWGNMQAFVDPRLTLYVTNESNGKHAPADVPRMQKAVKWWTRMMELAANQHIRLVLPNWGPGLPDMEWFTDDALWAVIAPLYQAFKKYPIHYASSHEYFWKELDTGNGHIGRHRDMVAALKRRGIEGINWILTEVGSDDIYSRKQRGWKNTVTEQQYIDLLRQAKREAWNDDYIQGACIFSYGGSNEWPPFSIMHATDLHKALIDMNNETVPIPTPPAPTPPYVIIPPNLGTGERFTIQLGSTLQAKPSADVSCKVGSLIPGETVTVWRKSNTVAEGFIWHYFERFSTPLGELMNGWTSHVLPPPIVVTPPPDEIAQIAAIVSKLHGMALLMESAANDLHKLAVALAAKKVA